MESLPLSNIPVHSNIIVLLFQTAMREQDLKLLKQLIHINETIRRLSSGRRALHERSSSCNVRLNNSHNGYSTLPVRKPPLLRQQSEPRFCLEEKNLSRTSSTSSEQGMYHISVYHRHTNAHVWLLGLENLVISPVLHVGCYKTRCVTGKMLYSTSN